MLGALFAILAPLLSFAAGSAFPNPALQTIATQKYFTARCYQIEPKQKLVITKEDLDLVHEQFPTKPFCYDPKFPQQSPNGLIDTYTRIRKDVSIIDFKIENASNADGGCNPLQYEQDETPPEVGLPRWVAQQGDKKIYWMDLNYQRQDVSDFLYVLKNRADKAVYFQSFIDNRDYVFDIYARDSILNKLPDYIKNCKETGGLVPVTEGESGILPPQLVPMKDVDTSGFSDNYNKILASAATSFPPSRNYLIKIDKQNLPADSIASGQWGIYKTSTRKDSAHTYDVFYHLGSFYLRDQGDGTSYVYGTSAEGPPQSIGNNPSLQLGRLWFMVVDRWTVFTPSCKPAIYLYPSKPAQINVKVNPLGKLTKTDPDYNPGVGWNVDAYPDGSIQQSTINNQQLTYPYLYYEAELEDGYKPKAGWIIDRENSANQLAVILTQLGLSKTERNDFLSYWVGRLNSKPYYFAGLVAEDEIEKQEKLIVEPAPDNIIRVRLIFEGLDHPISVAAPPLPEIKRSGFTVVDWGGSLVGETCEGKRIQ